MTISNYVHLSIYSCQVFKPTQKQDTLRLMRIKQVSILASMTSMGAG